MIKEKGVKSGQIYKEKKANYIQMKKKIGSKICFCNKNDN